MSTAEHWNRTYGARAEEALTWFEATPETSMALVRRHARPGDAILDAGGGASRLAETCLAEGYGPVTVVDLSESALAAARDRLGAQAGAVTWIAADLRHWLPDRRYALWHDRAAFHFLTDPSDQAAYLGTLDRALVSGGIAIVATFAEDGPERCSDLPVQRYAPDALAARIEAALPGRVERLEAARHRHVTPKGNVQAFQISVFRKLAD